MVACCVGLLVVEMEVVVFPLPSFPPQATKSEQRKSQNGCKMEQKSQKQNRKNRKFFIHIVALVHDMCTLVATS